MRAVLLIVLVTAGFYWKLTLTGQYVWFDTPDMCYLEIPRLQFMAREIHQGRFPLWDPHIWMGQPLIGQTQPGPLNPLNLLFLLLPLRGGSLRPEFLNGYFVVLHALAALGAYALCRELRRSRAASLVGACAFSFGGFLGGANWLDILSGAIWTPLVCLFFVRAARGRRPLANAGLSGMFLGISWLSGHHEIPLLTSLALAAAWVALLPRKGRAALPPAGVTFLIAAMTGAAQLWPTWEFGRLARRWGPPGPEPAAWHDVVSYLSSEVYSLTPRGLAGLLLPGQGPNGESTGFLGVVGVLLAAVALCSAWRLPPVRWSAAVGGAAVVYALGAFTPLHGILYAVLPELHRARVPVRALHLAGFALAVLAAYGADQLLRRRGWRWIRLAIKASAVLGILIVAGAASGKLGCGEGMVLCGWVAIALCAAILLWRAGRIGRAGCAVLLVCLMLTELHEVYTRAWQNRAADNAQPYTRSLSEHRDVADFLRREPGVPRVRVNDQDVPGNFGDLHSINMLEGYVAGVTANHLRLGRHMAWAQRLYGVSHSVARAPDRPGLAEAFTGQDGLKAFRVPDALPRAWSAHAAVSVASAGGIEPLMSSPAFDPARAAVLVGEAPALERCQGSKVEVKAYAPNRVRLDARMPCRGMVQLSDTFYPGWRAFVDGRETRIWETYGSLRGVVVEAGAHEVEFRFRPLSVFAGSALTAAGVLLALGAAAAARLRWRG